MFLPQWGHVRVKPSVWGCTSSGRCEELPHGDVEDGGDLILELLYKFSHQAPKRHPVDNMVHW